jgi:hypothetical protein
MGVHEEEENDDGDWGGRRSRGGGAKDRGEDLRGCAGSDGDKVGNITNFLFLEKK